MPLTFSSFVKCNKIQQEDEIEKASAFFENINIETSTFAYPFGDHSSQLKQVIQDGSMIAARAIEYCINMHGDDPFLLKSFMVEDKHTLKDVQIAVEDAIKANGWLILTFHHIDDKTFISTPPEQFREMIAYIRKRNVQITTIKDGISRLLS